ncbi:MAG: chromate efflux transporter [Alphaproteobacteria bacterium]|nr:chromate efflux transporter [Alphaproteobacteria bacterium]
MAAGEDMTPAPSFREALAFWFRLGCISFGGPAGQIAIMQSELVERRRWIDQTAFLQGLNFCMLLPGPEAQQLATYVGWRLHGWAGAVAAGCLFVLPGALVLLCLAWIAAAYGGVGPVAAIFDGIKPMVVAIIAHAVWRIGRRSLHRRERVALAALAFLCIWWLGIDFPWIVLGAGLVGILSTRLASQPFAAESHGGSRQGGAMRSKGPAALPGGRPVILGLSYLLLLVLPVGLAVLAFGRTPFLEVARFFTQAAFVTFGGAYAVLPYIAEAAVKTYGWLPAGEMLNGLALAETTPGPLILVTQYVGFFAGWNHPGAMAPAMAGSLAAALTTYVTFLPSIFFILIGAPYVVRLAGHPVLGAGLTAITAAVVGVILNLAAFMAEQVLFPGRSADAFAIALAILAMALLLLRNLAIHWLVLIGAGIGLGRWLLLP